jgi:hypothetical protein
MSDTPCTDPRHIPAGQVAITNDQFIVLGLGCASAPIAFTPDGARVTAKRLLEAADIISNNLENSLLSTLGLSKQPAQRALPETNFFSAFAKAMRRGWESYQQDTRSQ